MNQPQIDRKREAFEEVARALRPKLHRYCARMAGSSIDGEDIVQETLLKAMQAYGDGLAFDSTEAWLFRIAHNTALDFLRKRIRLEALAGAVPDADIADPTDEVARRENAAIGLRPFMKLSPAERSSVILMDVIGYSLREIGDIMGTTVPAIKASLHRGRTRLTALQGADDAEEPSLNDEEQARLARYVALFNARDFDAVRDMLAEDARLDLVARQSLVGKPFVGKYFTKYCARDGWRLAVGHVDGRPAVLSHENNSPTPNNFILLEWRGGQIVRIRDFYFAPYVTEAADIAERDGKGGLRTATKGE
ncbi:MAG: sigma-70 family RNA polymerase sigma factor [Mesorhizobium sp.]|nr:sigma-70 family RNA polymerase sigma factor [Mesorhizobium sp.]MBN9243202.1 sigma-70 family RNA polymerase sigma factor [Mesorhizobium sp.]